MKRALGLSVFVVLTVFIAAVIPFMFLENSAHAATSWQEDVQTPIPTVSGEMLEGVLDIQIPPDGTPNVEFRIVDPAPFATRVPTTMLPSVCYGGRCSVVVVVDVDSNQILLPLGQDISSLQIPLVASREQADEIIRKVQSAEWSYNADNYVENLDAILSDAAGTNLFRSPSLPLKYGQPFDETSFDRFWDGISPNNIDIYSDVLRISYTYPSNPLPWTPVPCYYPCCYLSAVVGSNVCDENQPGFRLDWLGDLIRQFAPPD